MYHVLVIDLFNSFRTIQIALTMITLICVIYSLLHDRFFPNGTVLFSLISIQIFSTIGIVTHDIYNVLDFDTMSIFFSYMTQLNIINRFQNIVPTLSLFVQDIIIPTTSLLFQLAYYPFILLLLVSLICLFASEQQRRY